MLHSEGLWGEQTLTWSSVRTAIPLSVYATLKCQLLEIRVTEEEWKKNK